MATVIELGSRRMAAREQLTEEEVLLKVAAYLRKWETALPSDSNWRRAFAGCAQHMERGAAMIDYMHGAEGCPDAS